MQAKAVEKEAAPSANRLSAYSERPRLLEVFVGQQWQQYIQTSTRHERHRVPQRERFPESVQFVQQPRALPLPQWPHPMRWGQCHRRIIFLLQRLTNVRERGVIEWQLYGFAFQTMGVQRQ